MKKFLLLLFLSFASLHASIKVGVSILPLQYFVERIGKENVDILTLLGKREQPETFEILPRQMEKLSQVSIYFSLAFPFEESLLFKMQKINPQLRIVDLREQLEKQGITLIEDDLHIWTSPFLAKEIAKVIYKEFITKDPQKEAFYKKNFQELEEDLERLDRSIQKQLQPLKNRTFFVYHPAWSYYAFRYQLEQIAIEKEGKAPTTRYLASLITLAKEKRTKVIFVQHKRAEREAMTIAHAIGARIEILDPLDKEYIDNMDSVTKKVIQALSYE